MTAQPTPSLRYRRARGLIPKPKIERAPKTCEIYFIRAVTLGFIKIGKADNARARFRNLRTMSPDTLVVLGRVICERSGALERELHQRFAADRLHGEWFRPTPELLEYIAQNVSTPNAETGWRDIRRA